MTSTYIYQRDPDVQLVESDRENLVVEQEDSALTEDRDDIPLLLHEVRQHYDVQSVEGIQSVSEGNPTETEALAAFEEAIHRLNDANVDGSKSCASCSEEILVQKVISFKRGQHISMPGHYNEYTRRLGLSYKHHAIIKEIKRRAGTRVKMVLIHFSKENGSIKIYQAEKTYDLTCDKICIIQYTHPRYSADEIVRRAESMLQENEDDQRKFGRYNPFTRNCEHFATWCVVGQGESIQIQGFRNTIANVLRKLFGNGSQIAKAIVRLLYISSDEIAAGLNEATHAKVFAPEIVLGVSAGLYLLYCIVMSALHIMNYKKGQMCWSCLKGKLQDLWLAFGLFGATSLITFIIFHFALPLMAPGIGIPLIIILVLLSALLQWSVPKIRKALQNPFSVDKTVFKTLSEINIGDIISLPYYGLRHVMVVSEVHEENEGSTKGRVRGIHYALPHFFGTREIMEEYFQVDLTRDKLKLYDCRHLLCYTQRSVVMRARKRVGETKWALGKNRSDHFCYWAKVQQRPNGVSEEWDNEDLEESESKGLSSPLFIEKKHVHLTSDIKVGDVIQFKGTGIIVEKVDSEDQNGRGCKIEMIVYNSLWYFQSMKYDVDLNKDRLNVMKYHPAHCHPMVVRAERAKELKGKKGKWWSNQGFIEHCLMLNQ